MLGRTSSLFFENSHSKHVSHMFHDFRNGLEFQLQTSSETWRWTWTNTDLSCRNRETCGAQRLLFFLWVFRNWGFCSHTNTRRNTTSGPAVQCQKKNTKQYHFGLLSSVLKAVSPGSVCKLCSAVCAYGYPSIFGATDHLEPFPSTSTVLATTKTMS